MTEPEEPEEQPTALVTGPKAIKSKSARKRFGQSAGTMIEGRHENLPSNSRTDVR
jgi:hypothetical protein